MASSQMTVTVSVNPRWAIAWLRMLRLFAFLGERRVMPLARWGAIRLTRIKFDDGPWRFMDASAPEVK